MVTQQRVTLKFGTTQHSTGTVSKIFKDGSFQVSYDSYRINGRRIPGGRFVYPANRANNFKCAPYGS